MFGFFRKSKKTKCPIPEENRIWMEDAFKWLISEFTKEKIVSRKILRPTTEDFPFQFDQSENDASTLLPVIANQMEVEVSKIELRFYDQALIEFSTSTGKIFSQEAPGEQYSAGTYSSKKNGGKFIISIEASQLKNTENLIATLAHEVSHIKLIGERRIKKNDEYLTDLVPIIYGLGIFNANSSFKFYNNQDSWGYNKQGYLSQQEWGYALALFAFIRNEEKKPAWINYLTPNIKSDFLKSEQFIHANSNDMAF
jgi:hypothetical protein